VAEPRRTFPLAPALLAAAVALYAAYAVRQALLPFLLSLALAYIVNPIIDAAQMKGMRRSHAVLVLYILAASLLAILGQHLLPLVGSEFARLQADAPAYLATAQDFTSQLMFRVAKRLPRTSLPLGQMAAHAGTSALEQLRHLPDLLLGLFPLLSLFFLVPLITFFLLVEGPDLISGLIQATPSFYVEQSLHLLDKIDAALGHYLRGLLIVAFAITVASYLGLLALGVNGALAIAILSGVSSFVPYLGAIMGALVGGVAAGFQFGTMLAGLKVVALFIGIRIADEMLLQPVIARHSLHLHPLAFLLSLMIGGELFGFLGLVFAVPTVCVIKALLHVAWEWYASQAGFQRRSARACPETPYT